MGFFEQFGKLASEKGRYQQLFGTDTGEALYNAVKAKDEVAAIAAFASWLRKKIG